MCADAKAVVGLRVEKMRWMQGLAKVSDTIVTKTCACGVGCGAGPTRYVEVTGAQRRCMCAKVVEDDVVEICDENFFSAYASRMTQDICSDRQ